MSNPSNSKESFFHDLEAAYANKKKSEILPSVVNSVPMEVDDQNDEFFTPSTDDDDSEMKISVIEASKQPEVIKSQINQKNHDSSKCTCCHKSSSAKSGGVLDFCKNSFNYDNQELRSKVPAYKVVDEPGIDLFKPPHDFFQAFNTPLNKEAPKAKLVEENGRSALITDELEEKLLLSDLLLFFVHFQNTYSLNKRQMDGVFDIIETFLDIKMPPYDFLLEKYFEKNCICCFVCKKCNLIHRCAKRRHSFCCYNCGDNIYDNFFYYSSFIQYLLDRSKDPKFMRDLHHYKEREKKEGVLSDIFDGFTFQSLKKSRFPNEKANELNFGLIFNADGVSVNKKTSIWPFFLSIANVSRENRKNLSYNHMFAICEKAKEDFIFQAVMFLMVEELQKLQKGIEISVENEKKEKKTMKISAYLICVLVDLPARAKILQQVNHNGYNSC